MSKQKRNRIREGLNIDKKLKKGFYYFLYEKNIDWAIIIGVILLMLPYIASNAWCFLTIKLILLLSVIFLVYKYLKTWNSLRKLHESENKLKGLTSKNLTKDALEKLDLKKIEAMFEELKIELLKEREKFEEQKSDQYDSFEDYLKSDKEDFSHLEKIFNKIDSKNFLTGFLLTIAFMSGTLNLSEIPKEELKNYKRLLLIIAIAFIFFIIYAVEYWLNKPI